MYICWGYWINLKLDTYEVLFCFWIIILHNVLLKKILVIYKNEKNLLCARLSFVLRLVCDYTVKPLHIQISLRTGYTIARKELILDAMVFNFPISPYGHVSYRVIFGPHVITYICNPEAIIRVLPVSYSWQLLVDILSIAKMDRASSCKKWCLQTQTCDLKYNVRSR